MTTVTASVVAYEIAFCKHTVHSSPRSLRELGALSFNGDFAADAVSFRLGNGIIFEINSKNGCFKLWDANEHVYQYGGLINCNMF